MSDNYVLSGLWLVATVGGIGYLGYTKTIETRHAAQQSAKEQTKANMMKAIQAANSGQFAEAARMLEALQAEHPTSTSITLNLGIAYSALEMFAEADAQFEKVLEENPKDWDAVAERAKLKALQGDEAAGIAALEGIPEGEGQLDKRLVADPVWLQAKDQVRLQALRKKHGVPDFGDTASKRLREMERRRAEFEAANVERGKKATAKGDE